MSEDENENERVIIDDIKKAMNDLRNKKRNDMRREHKLNQEIRTNKTRNPSNSILISRPIPISVKIFLKEIGYSIPDNNLLRRTQVTGELYEYIRTNDLYLYENSRRTIVPDSKIRKLFSLSYGETLDILSINTYMADIYKEMLD